MYGMLQKGQPAMGTRSRQAKAVVKTVSTALCQILCLCKAPFQMVIWWSGTSMKMYEDAWSILKYGMGSMGFTCAALVPWVPAGISFILKARTTRLASGSFSSAWQHMHDMAWHAWHMTTVQRGATLCNVVQRGATLWPLRCWWIWSGWLSWTCPNQRTWATERQFSDERLSRQLHRSWAPLSTIEHPSHVAFEFLSNHWASM